MRSLLVLCAGNQMVDNRPLILSRHPDGKMIAEKVIEGVHPEDYDRIIYVMREEMNAQHNAEDRILKEIGKRYPIEIAKLKAKTSGPAETAYKAIQNCRIDGEIAVRDSHSFIQLGQNVHGNFVAGLDLIKQEETIDNLRSKSFIVVNKQQQILDIVEKRFCSDVISGGLYGFKDAEDFLSAFEKLNDDDYPIKKMYVSHIISYLIGYSKRIFHCADISSFEDWSAQNSWMRIQRKYATYFLDLDTLNDSCVLSEQVRMNLKKVGARGKRFVLFSAHSQHYVDQIAATMREEGINIAGAVGNCTKSSVKAIIDDERKLNNILQED